MRGHCFQIVFILTRVSKDMPIYRPLVPNGHSDSPQMISGSGLELSGGKFSLKDLAKGVGKAANVAIPLAQAFGVEGADQAAAVNNETSNAGDCCPHSAIYKTDPFPFSIRAPPRRRRKARTCCACA